VEVAAAVEAPERPRAVVALVDQVLPRRRAAHQVIQDHHPHRVQVLKVLRRQGMAGAAVIHRPQEMQVGHQHTVVVQAVRQDHKDHQDHPDLKAIQ
jgi:non-ribosomal peptide synthetase component E (peptide arylation enzyme)